MSGLFTSNDTAMHNEFMGFVMDDASMFAVRGWAERQGYPQATVQQGGPDMFARMLEAGTPPKMAIVDLDGQSDPATATTRLATLCGRECRLIMTGSTNDVGLYRRVIGAGAVDYLVKPLTAEQLNQALSAAQRHQPGEKQAAKEARIIAIIGTRGGVGASTLALNTGWLMAHELGFKTILLDLDLQFGTSSLALDLEPGRGLRDIVGSPHRVDSLMISSSITQESPNFSVLGAEEAVDDIVHMDGGAITALMKEMKANFEVIIIDLPHFLFASQKRLLPIAHEIVIVSELTLAGIRDTLRMKSAIAGMGCNARLMIVASRTNASGSGQIDPAVFEKGIQGKIDATIIDDAQSVTMAANSGKSLGETSPRSALTKAIRDLARKLANVEESSTGKPSLWDKLVGKKNKGDVRSRA